MVGCLVACKLVHPRVEVGMFVYHVIVCLRAFKFWYDGEGRGDSEMKRPTHSRPYRIPT